MSSDPADLSALQAELAELALAAQQAAADRPDLSEPSESVPARAYPSEYISRSSPEYQRVSSLWRRFQAWIDQAGASSDLRLNPVPAPAEKLFAIQEELAQGAEEWSLPQDVLASFACHDGQEWSSTTGVMGRWYLLDCQTMFCEWRDQKDMMEMGLYSAAKYTQASKAQPRHPRIDTSYWFNPGWIPIACSRGSNLGGDLICIDMAPLLRRDAGQVILYFTESAERIVLADSLGDWLSACVAHLEAGVYRFDADRHTYVAGAEEAKREEEKQQQEATANDSSAIAATGMPTGASSTIGVEAFMCSALEQRDFFIKNQTEALVYLPDNDFGLLATDGLTALDGLGSGGPAV